MTPPRSAPARDDDLPEIPRLVDPDAVGPPRRPARTSRARGRPAGGDGAETRARILDAARRCFARLGSDRTTSTDIAAEADVSPGTIYHHFDSKPALFVAVGDHAGRAVFTRFQEVVAEAGDLRARVAALMNAFADLAREDPTIPAIIAIWSVELERNPEVRELVGDQSLAEPIRYYETIAEVGQRHGELGAVPPRGVAALVVALLYGLSMLLTAGPDDEFMFLAVEAFVHLTDGSMFTTPTPAKTAPNPRKRTAKR